MIQLRRCRICSLRTSRVWSGRLLTICQNRKRQQAEKQKRIFSFAHSDFGLLSSPISLRISGRRSVNFTPLNCPPLNNSLLVTSTRANGGLGKESSSSSVSK